MVINIIDKGVHTKLPQLYEKVTFEIDRRIYK